MVMAWLSQSCNDVNLKNMSLILNFKGGSFSFKTEKKLGQMLIIPNGDWLSCN